MSVGTLGPNEIRYCLKRDFAGSHARRGRFLRASLWFVVQAVFLMFGAVGVTAGTLLSETFGSYETGSCLSDGESVGPWAVVFNGYGCTQVTKVGSNKVLELRPDASGHPLQTHSVLVLGPGYDQPFSFTGRLYTARQLRTGSAPNPWEVAWIVWNYRDNALFYYFIPKTTGWELGKRDPAYPGGQRFLRTGSSPTFPLQRWHRFEIVQQTEDSFEVYVNGRLITRFTDDERPYAAGRIGFYSEDADVYFDTITVTAP